MRTSPLLQLVLMLCAYPMGLPGPVLAQASDAQACATPSAILADEAQQTADILLGRPADGSRVLRSVPLRFVADTALCAQVLAVTRAGIDTSTKQPITLLGVWYADERWYLVLAETPLLGEIVAHTYFFLDLNLQRAYPTGLGR